MNKPFDFNAVSPEAGPQFSPNLYAWLRKNFKKRSEGPEVFRSEHGALYVGYMFDGDFIGAALSGILYQGARTGLFSYSGEKFTRIASFWPKYKKLGRCYLDPKHQDYYLDKRWKEGPRRRTCLWCGHVQKKVSVREVVVKTRWVAA